MIGVKERNSEENIIQMSNNKSEKRELFLPLKQNDSIFSKFLRYI